MNWPADYINQVTCGDALSVLKTIPDGVIQTCITSPPYWGLRDYGVPGQIGLEKTLVEYTDALLLVFNEVYRVLKDDGTLWLNLGDSYYAGGWECKRQNKIGSGSMDPKERSSGKSRKIDGLKIKDLVGVPWMIAFALRNAGWYLRQDIIWSKPNPMPESVTDRCTKAHEYIFLLSKSQRYYCDMDAIREPVAEETIKRLSQSNIENQHGSDRAHAGARQNGPMKPAVRGQNYDRKPRGWDDSTGDGRHGTIHKNGREQTAPRIHGNKPGRSDGGKITQRDRFARTGPVGREVIPGQTAAQHRPEREDKPPDGMRNKRSVWTIPTEAFKDAHFATYPVKLIQPCILAGTSEKGNCAKCGKPWKRKTEKVIGVSKACPKTQSAHKARGGKGAPTGTVGKSGSDRVDGYKKTIGWVASCGCGCGTVPAIVLDPFSGSGTTAHRSEQLGRKFVAIELNPDYLKIDLKRRSQTIIDFNQKTREV